MERILRVDFRGSYFEEFIFGRVLFRNFTVVTTIPFPSPLGRHIVDLVFPLNIVAKEDIC